MTRNRLNLEGYRKWAYGRGYEYFVYAHAYRGHIFYVGMGQYLRPYEFVSRNKRWKQYVRGFPRKAKDIEVIRLSRHRIKRRAELAEARLIEFYDPFCNLTRPSVARLLWSNLTTDERMAIIRRKRKD